MAIERRGKAGIWQVDVCIGGERIRRSTGTSSKERAKEVEKKILSDAWRLQKLGIRPDRTWLEAANLWLDMKPRGRSDLYTLGALHRQMGNPLLKDMDTPYFVDLRDEWEDLAAGTVNRRINLILAILNNAKQHAYIDHVAHFPKLPNAGGRVRWLTGAEWQRLHDELPEHLRIMTTFAVNTGLRRANVTHLRWQNVDLARRVVWVDAENSKNGTAIGIPLNDAAYGVLRTLRDSCDGVGYVFLYHGAPIHRTVGKAWHEACKRAGLSDFRWHDLRHTWASWAVMAGVRLEELQRLGGWKTIDMVQRYAHLSPEHLSSAANKVKPPVMAEVIELKGVKQA